MLDTAQDRLLALAPPHLPNYRTLRYVGTDLGVHLAELAPDDLGRVDTIYRAVKDVQALFQTMVAAPDFDRLAEAVRPFGRDPFLAASQRLGDATVRAGAGPHVRKVLHDLRGGALTALVGTASLLAFRPPTRDLLHVCACLARDHTKIMRNALVDLDPPGRQHDLEYRPHSVDKYVRTWDGSTVWEADRALTVTVDCGFRGAIAACCLENAAVDRVLYNHLNNAARFAADGQATLTILPADGGPVRVVISNRLAPVHREWLAAVAGDDLRALYRGGLTDGGSGIGLSACADFVAACFGLPARDAAIDGGYLGARLHGDLYDAWFHWPVVVETGPDQLDRAGG